MKTQTFNTIVDDRVIKIKKTLASKAKEYAKEDRLHNFKVAATIANITPEKALSGMALKHLVSVMDLVNYPETVTLELVDEKIGDSINYLILLEAILKENLLKK